MTKFRISLSLLLLVGMLTLPFLKLASAQDRSGLAVSPPSFELSANPGDVLENSIRVDNLTDEPQEISVDKRNFVALGEEGQVDLTEEEKGSFSLASWMTVSPSTISIAPKASHNFKYTIKVPSNAQPGGRFGSIVFKTAAKPVTGQSGVAVGQEIGALIFVRIAGDITEKASIVSFSSGKFIHETGPIKFDMRVKNEGNVFFKPSGNVTIVDVLGNQVATVPVNSLNVLPEAVRRMDASWQSKWLVGKYTATVSLAYGTENQVMTGSTTFWVVPYKIIAIIIAVLLFAGYLVVRGRKRIKRALHALRGKE